MIKSIEFQNFKVLRNTALPLGRFTLIVGPNGSGKSTALEPFQIMIGNQPISFQKAASTAVKSTPNSVIQVKLIFEEGVSDYYLALRASFGSSGVEWIWLTTTGGVAGRGLGWNSEFWPQLQRIRVYSLDPRFLHQQVPLQPNWEFNSDLPSLAGVLDRLRDLTPERFEALNVELHRLLPEFDRILFDTPAQGYRAFLLRTREGHHPIPAADLSQGTLLALTILTLAYLPDPPPVIGLEEPDRGIHPRLLRQLRDALYRLSYPESFGEKRPPVQVIATTQSPYFLDLFTDHPEQIVIAEKAGLEARFERLMDRPDMQEILGDAPLGEAWYSGVLGGVPSRS
jgi:energy-coupling factor transporter ATP-binding protein EcfA2